MKEKASLEAAAAQIAALRDQPGVRLDLSAEAAMVIISQLQLALRHPQNVGPGSEHARTFIQGLRERIAKPGDPLDTLIGMGFEERFDTGPFPQSLVPQHSPPRPVRRGSARRRA